MGKTPSIHLREELIQRINDLRRKDILHCGRNDDIILVSRLCRK